MLHELLQYLNTLQISEFSTNIRTYWCCFVCPTDCHFYSLCPFHSVFSYFYVVITPFNSYQTPPSPTIFSSRNMVKQVSSDSALPYFLGLCAEHPHLFRCWSISSVEFLGSSGMSLQLLNVRQQGGFLRCRITLSLSCILMGMMFYEQTKLKSCQLIGYCFLKGYCQASLSLKFKLVCHKIILKRGFITYKIFK